MPIDRKLLAALRCPVSKRALRPMPADKIRLINADIESGQIYYADGRKVTEVLVEALVTDTGTTAYRIDDGIPVMFEDDSIPLAQRDDSADSIVEPLFQSDD